MFESSEANVSSESWSVYFNSETERDKFVCSVSQWWGSHYQVRQDGEDLVAVSKFSYFRRHFQMHFLQWLCMKISLKFVPKVRINNIPALVQRQAVIWTNDGLCCRGMYTTLGLNVLNYPSYSFNISQTNNNRSGHFECHHPDIKD